MQIYIEPYDCLISNVTQVAGRERWGYFKVSEIASSIVENNETDQRKKNFGSSKSTIEPYRLNQQEKVLRGRTGQTSTKNILAIQNLPLGIVVLNQQEKTLLKRYLRTIHSAPIKLFV